MITMRSDRRDEKVKSPMSTEAKNAKIYDLAGTSPRAEVSNRGKNDASRQREGKLRSGLRVKRGHRSFPYL